MNKKQCFRCKVVKEIANFDRNSVRRDGFSGTCKACRKEQAISRGDNRGPYVAEWYAKNQDRIRALRRDFRIKNRDLIAAKQQAWYASNPERARLLYRAKTALGRAVRKEMIAKPDTCEECGSSSVQITGAHSDYSKPLEVRWLCWSCHIHWDRAEPKLDRSAELLANGHAVVYP